MGYAGQAGRREYAGGVPEITRRRVGEINPRERPGCAGSGWPGGKGVAARSPGGRREAEAGRPGTLSALRLTSWGDRNVGPRNTRTTGGTA